MATTRAALIASPPSQGWPPSWGNTKTSLVSCKAFPAEAAASALWRGCPTQLSCHRDSGRSQRMFLSPREGLEGNNWGAKCSVGQRNSPIGSSERRKRFSRFSALGDKGNEDGSKRGPGFTERWSQRSQAPEPSTSFISNPSLHLQGGQVTPDHEDKLLTEDEVLKDEEIGDYESTRKTPFRADVENGARGIGSVLRAVGNSVAWGLSTSGRGLSTVSSGVQNRWRRTRKSDHPEPSSEPDPDSLGDSDSDSDWDGSEPEALPLPGVSPAAVDSEAYARQQEEASTSDSGQKDEAWEEPWETIKRWWNNPAFFRFRVSLSMANLTMALPTTIARVSAMYPKLLTLLTGQLSLPIMAPLLFGGGIAFKAIISNLGFVLPRLGVVGGVLWLLWAANYAMQESIEHLRNNGAIDRRISNVLVLTVELVASTIGLVTILSSVGIKIASLLLPGFAAVALAGKDVWHNYFAGFFLFAAQPFRPGDSVALLCGANSGPTSPVPPGWFEGVCESVDLRYTVLRNGRQRLLVPNSHFVNREFLVTDAGPVVARPPKVRTDTSVGVKNGRSRSPPGGTNGPPGLSAQKVSSKGQGKRGDLFPKLNSSLWPGQLPNGPASELPSPRAK